MTPRLTRIEDERPWAGLSKLGSSPQITGVIPSCYRPALLGATLESLAPHLERYQIPVLIGENCELSPELDRVVGDFAARHPGLRVELLDLTGSASASGSDDTTPGPGRMLAAVDRLNACVETPYIFHFGDDWWFSAKDFIAASKRILETFGEITIVRLTGSLYPPLPGKKERFELPSEGGARPLSFRLARYGGPGGIYGAFTFHPGLRRKADYLESFGKYATFGGEAEIFARRQEVGHREAILEEVFTSHLGTNDSRLGNSESGPGLGPTTAVVSQPGVYHLFDVGDFLNFFAFALDLAGVPCFAITTSAAAVWHRPESEPTYATTHTPGATCEAVVPSGESFHHTATSSIGVPGSAVSTASTEPSS